MLDGLGHDERLPVFAAEHPVGFFVASTRVAFRVEVKSGERKEWLPIRPDDPAGILDIMPVHITPNGKTYAYGYRRLLSDLYVVTGLL